MFTFQKSLYLCGQAQVLPVSQIGLLWRLLVLVSRWEGLFFLDLLQKAFIRTYKSIKKLK